jgi:hypothetical protein
MKDKTSTFSVCHGLYSEGYFLGGGKSRISSDQTIQINYKKGDGIMKFAVLVNEEFYLLTEDGAAYATFNTREEAEELALDFSDADAEVVAFV